MGTAQNLVMFRLLNAAGGNVSCLDQNAAGRITSAQQQKTAGHNGGMQRGGVIGDLRFRIGNVLCAEGFRRFGHRRVGGSFAECEDALGDGSIGEGFGIIQHGTAMSDGQLTSDDAEVVGIGKQGIECFFGNRIRVG